jgi:hypothetical protein
MGRLLQQLFGFMPEVQVMAVWTASPFPKLVRQDSGGFRL